MRFNIQLLSPWLIKFCLVCGWRLLTTLFFLVCWSRIASGLAVPGLASPASYRNCQKSRPATIWIPTTPRSQNIPSHSYEAQDQKLGSIQDSRTNLDWSLGKRSKSQGHTINETPPILPVKDDQAFQQFFTSCTYHREDDCVSSFLEGRSPEDSFNVHQNFKN